jgi:hypothetical protein
MKLTFEISKMLETYYCNMPLKTIATCAISPIYFYNIPMIQLQRTTKISETIETYNCNIGRDREPGVGSAMAVESAGIGGS